MGIKRSIKTMFMIGFLFVFVLSGSIPALAQEPETSSPPDYVPGEILVKFQPLVGLSGAQRSLQSAGLSQSESLPALSVSPQSGVVRIEVEPGKEQEAIDALLARGDVEFAGYNHMLYTAVIPDDTYYGSQWALPKIEAPAAWDISTGSSSITVGIVDSGLYVSNPEFSGRIVSPYDVIDDDTYPDDTCTHGTHVAGIIGAKGNNSNGMAGMAWNVNLLPVRTLSGSSSSCGGTESNVAEGIYWAVNNGADIINLSLGGSKSSSLTCAQVYPTMSAAVNYALSAGVLVTAAAGNSGSPSILCPAAMDGVMAVGSTTSSDFRSSFSNYGSELDIAAPGSSIYSTLTSSIYGYKSGTSMASPHVAGLAALIWSASPSLSRAEVIDIILDNADDLGTTGWDQYFGHGRINARRALESMSLQTSPAELSLLIDEDSDTVFGSINVQTNNTDLITWTATISPAVSWLTVASSSGTISASTSPNDISLMATTSGITYADLPLTTTVWVTGTNIGGAEFGPIATEVKFLYAPYKYYFPIMFKN